MLKASILYLHIFISSDHHHLVVLSVLLLTVGNLGATIPKTTKMRFSDFTEIINNSLTP